MIETVKESRKENFVPNIEQQAAIDKINGPVMLLAGPGTGKTFTLIKRIEKMLSCGITPDSILCLTFSDAASREMKTRLVEKTGVKGGAVNVSTYHSFCNEIIKQNPDVFEMADNVQMADDVTKQAILKECLDEFDQKEGIKFLKDKWGNKYFYLPKILNCIETIKRERTTEEEYFDYLENNAEWQVKLSELYLEKKEKEENKKPVKTLLNKIETQEKKIGKAKEFYSVFEIYRRKLSENNLIDYSDMINLVLDKMDFDEDFLIETVKNIKYVLVDEYQDTSKVQNELIFNIMRGIKNDNIFVVGDDDQIIYSFQGARSANLSEFLTKFKNTEVICLKENRRSTQTILDFADKLIENDKLRLTNHPDFNIQKKLIAKNEKVTALEEKIKFNIFDEIIQENNSIVSEIENLIKNGTDPKEISILTRKNDKLENFQRLLKQKNIPCAISKQKNAFEIPSFILIYSYLKILNNVFIEQDKLFSLLTSPPFKISDEDLAKLLILHRKTNNNWYAILKDNLEKEFQDSIEIKNFLRIYDKLRSKKSFMPLMPFLYEIITKTGILELYSNCGEECFENIRGIQRLIDEAQSYSILHKNATLEDFTAHLDTYLKQNIKIEIKKNDYEKKAVQLLTYHGSKGREFEYVFMPDLTSRNFEASSDGRGELEIPVQKSLFSNNKDINKDAELLRLLFVGITRAKYALRLSFSNADEGNMQTLTKYISNLFPDNNYLIEQKIYKIDENAKMNETVKNLTVQFGDNSYKQEVISRTENLIISQSSLNKYINCPLSYFYSDVLKIPVFVEDKDILSYGSSIHGAIDFMTKEAVKNGAWGKKEDMLKIFSEKMESSEFTTPEKREEFIQRGKFQIEENFCRLAEAAPEFILSTEYRMELNFEGTILKGFADRITKDNSGNIHIYDFKTGSYKKVKKGENYYNQLRFYKFLYEEINKNEKVTDCALIFFEEKCKQSSVEADITNNEEIKEIIRNVIKNIKALNFEPNKKDDNCKFCNFKSICNLKRKE